MSGAVVRAELWADPRLAGRLDRLAQLDTGPLLDAIGAEVETQTRRRISVDKASPAGVPWPDWSAEYAQTRHSGQALLQSNGHLLSSITHNIDGNAVLVGSPLVYAASHQFGDPDRGIPQREFLGLEGQDHDAVVTLIENYLEELANG